MSIAAQIHELRMKIYPLQELACKRVTLFDSGGLQSYSAPTPLNLGACDLLNQIRVLALLLARAAGLHPTRSMDERDLLKGLDQPLACERLAQRSDAQSISRLLQQASNHIDYFLTPDSAHVCVGICPHCKYGIWIDEHAAREGQRSCDICHQTFMLEDVIQAHYLRLMTCNVVGTASELTELLHKNGVAAARVKTISDWYRRGKLHNLSAPDQPKTYRLSELLQLIKIDK